MLRIQRDRFVLLVAFMVMGLIGGISPAVATQNADLWQALRFGGHVVLMRHALAPGTGDPDTFTLGDCSTQRILSQEGHEQAARIGDLFRENGIQDAQILSSQWCRCLETARGLALGSVQDLPPLNSFFQDRGNQDRQTRQLTDWLRSADLSRPTVLVTHQVNITALTGLYPQSGEMFFLRVEDTGDLVPIGSIQTQ
ncbi:MAG: histidine phosphatase family protein [Alphaproteobacteria bacterium]|nr:histidine phosphatase family protein [Alphaproteobacteria bacterium]